MAQAGQYGICERCGMAMRYSYVFGWIEETLFPGVMSQNIHTEVNCLAHLESAFELMLAVGRPPK